MKKLAYLLLASLAFVACEKIVEIDLPSESPRLVIEGQITNERAPWQVKLTLSQPYFDQAQADIISQAVVRIIGTDGSDVLLSHVDSGSFVSADTQQCVTGESYTLNVEYNGEEYQATEQMKNAFPLDTIASFLLPDNNGFIPSGYYVFIQGKENPESGDYYLFKAYRGDTLKTRELDNDEFGSVSYLNENIDADRILQELALGKTPRPFPFLVEPGDSILVEQFAITQQYYQFIIDLEAQRSRSGTPFDPPPANPNNNLSNGALGYFSVAHKEVGRMVVQE